jgi:hypothetical protein
VRQAVSPVGSSPLQPDFVLLRREFVLSRIPLKGENKTLPDTQWGKFQICRGQRNGAKTKEFVF